MNWQEILQDLRPLEVPDSEPSGAQQALTDALDRLLQLTERSAKLQFRSTEATENVQGTLTSLRSWIDEQMVGRERELEALRATAGEREDQLRRFALGVADMLDLLASAEAAARRDGSLAIVQWVERLAREQLKLAKRLTVEPTANVGDEFNPELHEAIDHVQSEQPSGSIAEVVRQGYRWHGQVVRVAKVIVTL